jgi:hypothetical protein
MSPTDLDSLLGGYQKSGLGPPLAGEDLEMSLLSELAPIEFESILDTYQPDTQPTEEDLGILSDLAPIDFESALDNYQLDRQPTGKELETPLPSQLAPIDLDSHLYDYQESGFGPEPQERS